MDLKLDSKYLKTALQSTSTHLLFRRNVVKMPYPNFHRIYWDIEGPIQHNRVCFTGAIESVLDEREYDVDE